MGNYNRYHELQLIYYKYIVYIMCALIILHYCKTLEMMQKIIVTSTVYYEDKQEASEHIINN